MARRFDKARLIDGWDRDELASGELRGEFPGMSTAIRAVMKARRAGSSLVAFHEEGSKPPLFLVHGRFGSVLRFHQYTEFLGTEQPFYALQPRVVDPDSRMVEMAARYLREIRALQPSGPYYIGGFCMGGVVAYEMAQQLVRDNERVGLLIMLDSVNPRARWSRFPMLSFAKLARRRFRVSPPVGTKFLLRIAIQSVAYGLRRPFRALGYPLPRILRYRSVTSAMRDALDYIPPPYPGKIVLFRSLYELDTLPDRGWESLAGGGLDIHEFSGALTNDTFVRGPTVRLVGEALRSVLDDAQRAADSVTARGGGEDE